MQFSNFFWGKGNNLKNPKNNQNKKYQKNQAFSLIELSIVLIIIGLLVAGITGGKSLIDSARQRAFINELNKYKQAVYAFKVAKNRLPGDLNDTGKIGYRSGQSYNENSFPSPYDGSDSNYGIPNEISAPWVDMYLEGIVDFQPKNVGGSIKTNTLDKDQNLPYSNSLSVLFYFEPRANGNIALTSLTIKKIYRIKPEIYKNIDEKIDDGLFNSGIFEGRCNNDKGLDYDIAIQTNKLCAYSYFKID